MGGLDLGLHDSSDFAKLEKEFIERAQQEREANPGMNREQ